MRLTILDEASLELPVKQSPRRAATGRDFLGIIDLNAEVSHGRLELGVSWKQLSRPKVLGAPLNAFQA